MISYELARELKDAGFLQAGLGEVAYVETAGDPAASNNPDYWQTVPRYYVSTLEELVEACGKPMWLEAYDVDEFLWMAGRGKGGNTPLGRGATPNEAVARLWLALNKTV
jgi:hypothetical protein